MNVLSVFSLFAVVAVMSMASCERKSSTTTSTTPAPQTPARTATLPTTPAKQPEAMPLPAPATPAKEPTAKSIVPPRDATKTVGDQSESAEHIKVTADIRRAILDDKSMSVSAQNCKVITDANGLVTLRGTVASQAEKDSIGAKAIAVAGKEKVDNQLEVKAG